MPFRSSESQISQEIRVPCGLRVKVLKRRMESVSRCVRHVRHANSTPTQWNNDGLGFDNNDSLRYATRDRLGHWRVCCPQSEVASKCAPCSGYLFTHPQHLDRNVLIQMLIVLLGVLLTLQASSSRTITGTLMCNGKPYAGAEVQLHGEDVTFLIYNLSALTTSDESGKFEVNYDNVMKDGTWLGFHHRCNYDGKCVLSRAYRFANDELSGKDSYSLGPFDLGDKKKGGEVCDGKLVV